LLLPEPTLIGVVNITPDSFSDGGNFLAMPDAVTQIGQLLVDGADIVELGGESTRPGAASVSVEDELGRVLPVLTEARSRYPNARFAVDTSKSEVAKAAIEAGATVINDVSALRFDPRIANVCAEAGANVTLALMHSRGDLTKMASYHHAEYPRGVMPAIVSELGASVTLALAAGVRREHIVLDPGIGFSKRTEHSIAALAALPELVQLGFPVMIGVSRKRVIGDLTGVALAQERDAGTVGANVAALALGARWFRVHNVRANRHALDAAYAIFRERANTRGSQERGGFPLGDAE
jgi:dihydropteroate synthase